MEKQRHKLRVARISRGLSQRELAKEIGVTRGIISDWERGKVAPYPYHIGKLCSFFGVKDLADLDLVRTTQSATSTPVGDQPNKTVASSSHTIPAIMETVCQLEKENNQDMDPLRRTTLQGLVSLGLARDHLFDPEPWERLSRAIVKPTSMNLEALAYFQQFIENGWKLCNTGEWDIAEHILDSFLSDAIRLVPKQREAAFLASQGLVLRSILQAHKLKLPAMIPLCQQAVLYAQTTGDHTALCASLNGLAVAFKYNDCLEDSFQTYLRALRYCDDQTSPLVRSRIYAGAAAAFARKQLVHEADLYIHLAYEIFPEHPEDDPHFLSADHGKYLIAYYHGLIHLALNQPDQAQKVFEHGRESSSASPIPQRNQLEIVNHQGRVAIGADKLDVYVSCLKDGIVGALALHSKKRLNEAVEIFRKEMPITWQNDQQIKQIVEQYPSLLQEVR